MPPIQEDVALHNSRVPQPKMLHPYMIYPSGKDSGQEYLFVNPV
jgi:hypothetical protein